LRSRTEMTIAAEVIKELKKLNFAKLASIT